MGDFSVGKVLGEVRKCIHHYAFVLPGRYSERRLADICSVVALTMAYLANNILNSKGRLDKSVYLGFAGLCFSLFYLFCTRVAKRAFNKHTLCSKREEKLTMIKRQHGEHSKEVAKEYNAMAKIFLQSDGDYVKAEKFAKLALRIFGNLSVLGDDPDVIENNYIFDNIQQNKNVDELLPVAVRTFNLAHQNYYKERKFNDAIVCFKISLEIFKRLSLIHECNRAFLDASINHCYYWLVRTYFKCENYEKMIESLNEFVGSLSVRNEGVSFELDKFDLLLSNAYVKDLVDRDKFIEYSENLLFYAFTYSKNNQQICFLLLRLGTAYWCKGQSEDKLQKYSYKFVDYYKRVLLLVETKLVKRIPEDLWNIIKQRVEMFETDAWLLEE